MGPMLRWAVLGIFTFASNKFMSVRFAKAKQTRDDLCRYVQSNCDVWQMLALSLAKNGTAKCVLSAYPRLG
jgi:hypothetical protein